MITEKKIDQRKWIGIRQASGQIGCTVKDLRNIIRQNKWKTQREKINNRRRVYLQKADVNQYRRKSLIVAPNNELNPLDTEAQVLQFKPILLLVEGYRKSLQAHQIINLHLTKRNYLLKISIGILLFLSTVFIWVGLAQIGELKKDNTVKTNTIDQLTVESDSLNKQLVGALNQTISKDAEIKALNDKLITVQEPKISH